MAFNPIGILNYRSGMGQRSVPGAIVRGEFRRYKKDWILPAPPSYDTSVVNGLERQRLSVVRHVFFDTPCGEAREKGGYFFATYRWKRFIDAIVGTTGAAASTVSAPGCRLNRSGNNEPPLQRIGRSRHLGRETGIHTL